MKQKKLWNGRFNKDICGLVENFTQSLSFDQRLAAYDIQGSLAHVEMLKKCNILTPSETARISQALKKILLSLQKNTFKLKPELEDIHMNIETALIEMTGDIGRKLHTGRSRNDQILTDVYLYLKDIINTIIHKLKDLQKEILRSAERNMEIILPGYTHLQQAQPVLASHYLLAYFFQFQRDKEHFRQALEQVNILPLGVGALAGVNYPTDRKYLAKLLNFKAISENSMDTVSNRDFMADFIYASAMTAVHFSRLAEDLIIWNTEEYKFIDIDDSFTTGSSIMPNKKNPDVLELVRGKSAHIIGYLNSILVLLKGLPLTYNRDLQEDKVILFNTVDQLLPIIGIMPELLKNIQFNTKSIAEKLSSGYILATDLADHLVKKNIPFRKAHYIAGRITQYCIQNEKSFFQLTLEEIQKFYPKADREILSVFNYHKSISSKLSEGSTSFTSVKKQIFNAKKLLKS